ncbi:MAG: YtxH domain-containing protein [Acidobacteria bacterium]|nr:YtxH domain-containing protein [Acidobacteriota bacterium]MDA1234944.1 YtxH domain-containing protein [Acidobacteriota bacterium]
MRDSEFAFLLMGVAVGAAVGLAIAPMEGRELRGLLAGEAGEGLRLSKAAMERSREARSVATDAFEVAQRARQLRRPL